MKAIVELDTSKTNNGGANKFTINNYIKFKRRGCDL